jgi:hypothetical protein
LPAPTRKRKNGHGFWKTTDVQVARLLIEGRTRHAA